MSTNVNYCIVKGTCQKRFSGFCPLRGGWGYPPFPLRVFGQDDFPLRGGGGYPPIPLRKIPLKRRYFRSKNPIFCLFYTFVALFGLLYGLFGQFLTLFNTKTSFLVLLGKKISGKA